MNYDDINEEGIPPYDLPGFGNIEDSSARKQNVPSQDVVPAQSNEAIAPQPQVIEQEIEELSLDSMQENPDININEEFPDENITDELESVSVQPDQGKKSSTGAKILLPFVIVFLGLFLVAGSLVLIYAEDLNIPYVSEMMAKLNGKNSDKVITVDEKEIGVAGPSAGGEELDAEMQKLMGEDSEGTGVELTRNNNALPMPNNDGVGPGGAVGMPNNIPGAPGMPQGNEGFPPLQNNLGQQSDINVIQPYSRNIGRLDPFNPSGGTNQLYDVIIPPTNPTPDEKAQQLMALKISGIMYTADSPSAIINIAGSDQLVRRGDKFNGFSVEKITKDKVTVRAGSNVYTASVGEILNIEQVGVNSIPNLNKKFGGPYSKGKDRIIEINMLE